MNRGTPLSRHLGGPGEVSCVYTDVLILDVYFGMESICRLPDLKGTLTLY